MIRESPELVAVAQRWVDALNRRDFETVANMFLRSAHGRYVGTDSHEWWKGLAYIDAYAAHQEEMPEYVVEAEEIEAFEIGGLGWAAVRTSTTFVGLEPRQLRFTFVFVLDAGFWKIAQSHGSIAVPNIEVMGVEMTKSLEDLLASVSSSLGAGMRGTMHRGTLTLMFTDIEGSTEMAASLGDDSWARVIEWHDRTIRENVEAADGTVVKTLGDGAMAVFDSVRQAALTAFRIQEAIVRSDLASDVRLRIGLHVGDVVFTKDDYLGMTVNKAARIAAAAEGSEIAVSSSVRALLDGDPAFRFVAARTVRLKGIEGLHEITSLERGSEE